MTTGHLLVAVAALLATFLPSVAVRLLRSGKLSQRWALSIALIPCWTIVLMAESIRYTGIQFEPVWTMMALIGAAMWAFSRVTQVGLLENSRKVDLREAANQ